MNVASMIARLSATGAAVLATGCAGGMTSAECAGADWTALGLADGAAGAHDKLFEERSKDCAGEGTAPDAEAYRAARAQGLQSYCSPEGGFAAGRAGGEYEDVCPADAEPAFLASFDLGAKLRALTLAREKAVETYETALADLDQHHYLLGVAEKRYAKPSISNEDRESERQDMEYRQREIVRIENDLPKLLDEIENSRAALEAFEAELKAEGRSF